MDKKGYFILWKKYLKLNVKVWMEYRADFIIGTIGMFLSNMISIVFFWVIFQIIPEMNGWTFGQLAFLVGFLTLSVGIWHLLFEGISPWRIERYIRNGDFDRILLRPFNSFVNLLINSFDMDAFGDIIAGILILFAGSQMIGIVWSISNILLFTLLISSSVLIFISLLFLISTLSFWIIRSREISNIIWHFMRFVEFPLEIYNPAIIFILTFVLPLGFISYYPSEILLGKEFFIQLAYLTPVVSIIYFIASYKFWKFGLKHYTSTGT